MPKPAKIAILFHEQDPPPQTYFIAELGACWQRDGLDVVFVRGLQRTIEADLVIPHIDLTIVPSPYLQALACHPRVINRRVHDISKRAISQNLLAADSTYRGPVIVKPDRNALGIPEEVHQRSLERRGSVGFARKVLRRIGSRIDPRRLVRGRNRRGYRIYPDLAEVPRAVFRNKSLVVERFLPERDGDLYCLRVYVFLGDRYSNTRIKSEQPIVKRNTARVREELPVPDEIVARRQELGFDYGKLDYVVHDGRPVLLDANKTPGESPKDTAGQSLLPVEELARGLATIPPVL